MSPDLTLGDGQNSGKYPGFQVRGSPTLGLLRKLTSKLVQTSKPELISGVNGPTHPIYTPAWALPITWAHRVPLNQLLYSILSH